MIWGRSRRKKWRRTNTCHLKSIYLEGEKMGRTDFTGIRLQHIAWRAKLNEFLKGKQSMTEEEATSHEACEVGKWLYSVGLGKYGMMEEIQELEKIHIELHATVRKIMSLKQSGDSHAETEALDKLDKILRKIMFLMVDIEEKLVSSGE
jgi:methyl-accepting chemotaxis protein